MSTFRFILMEAPQTGMRGCCAVRFLGIAGLRLPCCRVRGYLYEYSVLVVGSDVGLLIDSSPVTAEARHSQTELHIALLRPLVRFEVSRGSFWLNQDEIIPPADW